MPRKIAVIMLILFMAASCTQEKAPELDFLVGTWKNENAEQYEVWEKNSSTEFTGHSYRVKDGQKVITETLSIKKTGDLWVYEATVPSQNEGRTIPFLLNAESDSLFSFENPDHDFPKKIQYQKIDASQIKVMVLGDDEKGFSYIQVRQG